MSQLLTTRQKQQPDGWQEEFNRISNHLRSVIEDQTVESIYHYTSAEGFYNIIRNKRLFFTDTSFLNDSTEVANIAETLWMILEKLRTSLEGSLYDALLRSIRSGDFTTARSGCGLEQERSFVLACSYQIDSLNLWNYYAKGGNGVGGFSIGLQLKELVDSFLVLNQAHYRNELQLSSGRVIYDGETKKEMLTAFLLSVNELWQLVDCSMEDRDEKGRMLQRVRNMIRWAGIFFKNECFRSEEEYRIVIALPENHLLDYQIKEKRQELERLYKVRLTNNVFAPYIKLAFRTDGIKTICLSPLSERYTTQGLGQQEDIGDHNTDDVMIYGVDQFLKTNGFLIHPRNIMRSRIPLRF